MGSENRFDAAVVVWEKAFSVFAWLYPYLAITGILFVVALSIELGVYNLAKRGFQTVGIPVIIASITLIVGRRIRRHADAGRFDQLGYDGSAVTRLVCRREVTLSAFLLLFATSVLLLTVSQSRPWTYFVVIALMYALVIFQIIVREFDARILLVEVPLLMLNQIYGVTLKYQYYYGWTDIFNHVERAQVTHMTGRTVPETAFALYAKFPLYHIFVSEATYLFDLDLKTSLFVVTPIPYVVTAILLYYLLARSFRDERIPALITVLYSANTIVLFYGAYMITRTMAYVGFVFLLYIIYKRSNELTASFTFLLVFMTFFTTTVHQVSMPQIIILLILLYVCKRVAMLPRFLRLRTLVLITGIFVGYWTLYAWDFVMTLFNIYTRPEHYDEVVITSVGSESGNTKPLADLSRRARYLAQNYVIVFYAILGIGAGLYEEYTKYVHTLLLFSLATLGLFVPSPLLVIGQAMNLFRFDRFELLVSPFVAMAMGVGVVSFLQLVNRSRSDAMRWAGTVFAFMLVVTYVFSAVTAPVVASDSKDLPWSGSRKHLTESEVEGFEFVLDEVSEDSIIRADAHTSKFFDRLAYNDHETMYTYTSQVVFNVSNISQYEGYTIFRSEKFQEGGLEVTFAGPTLYPNAETKRVLYGEFREKNKIFTNGDIEIYYTNESRAVPRA